MAPSITEFCTGSSMVMVFLQNVKIFLEKYAEKRTSAPNVPCWSIILEFFMEDDKAYKIPLYVFELDQANADQSMQFSFCDHCRGAGWGHHVLSRRDYHFVIPKDGVFVRPEEEVAMFENSLKKGLPMDVSSSSLYGCFHGNGFGHLIKIQRADCKFLSGMTLIQLWDRICTKLGIRKISLRDSARKGLMDLRLLYAVGLEKTWFGLWGYSFCRGSFGITETMYNEALRSLRSLTLEQVIDSCGDDSERRKHVEKIIKVYREISTFEDMPVTIQGLFKRMLMTIMYAPHTPQNREHADSAYSFYNGSLDVVLEEDETIVAIEIVDSLNRRKRQWTKRVDLLKEEGSDRKEQFDKVLKKTNGKRVGKHVIKKQKSSHIEYKADAVGVPGCNIYSDIIYMYNHVFIQIPGLQSISESVRSNTQVVLDTVQFMREYAKPAGERTFICEMLGKLEGSVVDQYLGEILVTVQPGATFGDLKQEARRAIKETYCFCGEEHITVEAIEGYGDSVDIEVVPEHLVGLRGGAVGLVLNIEPSDRCLRTYQGGNNALMTVDCTQCGANEDDGELMVLCVPCWVLKHQRCHQMQNDQPEDPWLCPLHGANTGQQDNDGNHDDGETGDDMILSLINFDNAGDIPPDLYNN